MARFAFRSNRKDHSAARWRDSRRRFCGGVLLCTVVAATLALATAARADEAVRPCGAPTAATIADRPGTGRLSANGGAPCVVLPGDLVIEYGLRRQVTTEPGGIGAETLASVNLGFVRLGVARRLEFGIAVPTNQLRSVSGIPSFDSARGMTDVAVALKYLVFDSGAVQGSVGAIYSAPTGSGEFTAGAPTYATSANIAVAIESRLSLTASLVFGTAIGPDAAGRAQAFFAFSPSVTLAYALDAMDTLLVQDAFTSRQAPVLPAGSRGFVALQRALGPRLAVDVEFEMNLSPTAGRSAHAVGFGVVWFAHSRRKL